VHIFSSGSIGLIGKKSPPFSTHGRFLRSKSKFCQDAPFIIEQRKIIVDFGNSLPITKFGSFKTGFWGELQLGIVLEKDKNLPCGRKISWLGKVLNEIPQWYETTSGIQSFPSSGSLSAKDMELIKDHPLVVAQV